MVDDKRVDGMVFKFLEPGHEHDAVLTIAKHKYALKRHQLNPFLNENDNSVILKRILEDDYQFNIEIAKVNKV